ncbi:MAG TPA: PilZ domain-containing protein [Geobacteraceae bacterium]
MEIAREIIQLIRPDAKNSATAVTERQVDRKRLVNRLNYINFQDGTIQVNFRHPKYNRTISLTAKPLPCLDDRLDCSWSDTTDNHQKLSSYTFENLFVIDGQSLVVVEPELLAVGKQGISFRLPVKSRQVSCRKVRRHLSSGISVRLTQNSALFHGTLLDFNAITCRVEVVTNPPQTFQWINEELPVSVILDNGTETLYAGECRIIKQSFGQKTRAYVLEPLAQNIRRFRPKEFRSARQKLVPLPNVIFAHPLSGKLADLKVFDLSGSGFSVEEEESNSVLLPGLIIPALELNFANSFSVTCKAQVVYRQSHLDEQGGQSVKCGITFLDMAIEDHVRLLGLLHQAKDRYSYISKKVDLEALWNFFFETGFIYPEKYASIQQFKEQFRQTYEDLYTKNPAIARHFIYQDKGAILAHMAMVRFYENTWLIQHHAASKRESTRAGVTVLNQLNSSIIDSHSLYSLHMNYVICYFRPDNKFPDRVFGGFARHLHNPKGCSLDSFAYFHFQRAADTQFDMSGSWQMVKAQEEDLLELASHYEQVSGGLMISALDLEPDMAESDVVQGEFRRLGFKRERYLYALRKNGHLKAVVMVNVADIGLNLSDITTAIKVMVVDPEEFSIRELYSVLSILSIKLGQPNIPVLLFPLDFAEQQQIAYERVYTLFAISTQYSDPYFKFLQGLFRTVSL